MHKLSIQSFTTNSSRLNNHSDLNVESLSHKNNSQNETLYNAENIISTIKIKREKKLEIYMRHFNRCFEQIRMENNRNRTDIIYTVPDICNELFDYSAEECCSLLERKFIEKLMDTHRMSYKTIFITWKFIEYNKEKEKEQEKNRYESSQ